LFPSLTHIYIYINEAHPEKKLPPKKEQFLNELQTKAVRKLCFNKSTQMEVKLSYMASRSDAWLKRNGCKLDIDMITETISVNGAKPRKFQCKSFTVTQGTPPPFN